MRAAFATVPVRSTTAVVRRYQQAIATAMATSSMFWVSVAAHAHRTLMAMVCATMLTTALASSTTAASATALVRYTTAAALGFQQGTATVTATNSML